MNILAIETATEVLSLAVGTGAEVHETTIAAGQRQAELILAQIDALLARAGLGVRDLDGVAYGAGPGSFTGLRIACGVAQGIAAARGIPVLGVSTLAALAEGCGAARVIACLDARMGEVYHAAFEKRNGALHEVIPAGLHRPASVPLPPGDGWTGCGQGFAAHREALAARLGARLAAVRPDAAPSAAAILRLAAPRFAAGEGGDAATAAPVYLRERVALKTSER
ncbi:MAG TPA: tRNA (adenosine(37)-N6)-threonylcarbamoyltransferase complex dimerization subunit type 1 TsaB [Burkholderiales bacterium]|jgi:tRNA threonylcarbamoyladenosine biosynthesis protein TsaB|nr:tRNA (adenosine(37)-N6)-threonylcarbamoyltransferase complex dimerization subunit type 1 TsaB [Burkholderiales bacterium]